MTTNKPELTSKETETIDQSGAVMTIDQDGLSMPADYSFACVNDYIHSVDRHFEELQWLALGMANEIEKLRKDAERYRWLCDKFGITKLPCAIERILSGEAYVADGKEGIDAAIDAAMQELNP